MNNVKNKKSKHLLTAVLASLIVVSTLSVSVLSGCGENSLSTTETVVETDTSVVTKVVEETYYTDENGNVVSESSESDNSGNAENQSSENSNSGSAISSDNSSSENSGSSNKNNSNSSSKNNSNSSSSSNKSNSSSSNKSDNNSSSSSKNNSNNSSSKTLSIDGNKFSVGDTVTCVYQLTTPENLENFQAIIKYDSKYLKVKKAVTSGPAESGSVMNYNLDGQIKFNGVNISSGYNYKKSKDFVTVTYEVVSGGSTKPTFEWEVATGVSQKSYVEDGKAVNGMKLTTSYS